MKDISIYKEKLEEEKKVLEAELETVGRRNPLNPNEWEATSADSEQEPDPNDRADSMENFGENNAILTDLQARYKEVEAALGRIEAGTYGICEKSGEPIEEKRLEADPTARTSMAHMES